MPGSVCDHVDTSAGNYLTPFVDIVKGSFFDSDTSSVPATYVKIGNRYLDVRYYPYIVKRVSRSTCSCGVFGCLTEL